MQTNDSVPLDWLRRMRDNARRFGQQETYMLLNLIIRKWENNRDDYDEYGARLLGSGTADR